MHRVAVLLVLWILTTKGVNGFKVKDGNSKVSKHWEPDREQRSQVPRGSLHFQVTGNGKFSPDKNTAILQLRFIGNSPGNGPTGAPTEGVGSSTTGALTQPTQGTANPQLQQEFSPFEMEALNSHNDFRRTHDATPMRLDKTMCQEAAQHAAKLARSGMLQHSPPPGQGENLSMGCRSGGGEGQTAKQAVTNWYNEVCRPGYNFDRSGYQSGTGHFTQVVWRDSTVLGIGKADSTRNGMKCTYIVGRYKPQGNFDTGNDDYRLNVKKGSFQRSYCNTINNPSGGFWDKSK